VFLRMMPEAQQAFGERALLYMFHEQIKDSKKLHHEMHTYRRTKEKDAEYKRIHTIEWLREQINDWEAEQIRLSVREGIQKGIRDGTDTPGGAGSGLPHVAAPGIHKWTKAQRKQSALDKNKHALGILDAQSWRDPAAPGTTPRGGKGKGKGKDDRVPKDKMSAPTGTCFQWWEHGTCDRGGPGQCKWEHVRPNSPSAPAFIRAGKIADKAKANASPKAKAKAKAKAKGKGKGKTATGDGKGERKPKSQTLCRFLSKGTCKKGKDCDYSHDKTLAAPAAERKKEKRERKKTRKKAAAGAVEEGVNAAGIAVSSDSSSDCSDTS